MPMPMSMRTNKKLRSQAGDSARYSSKDNGETEHINLAVGGRLLHSFIHHLVVAGFGR